MDHSPKNQDKRRTRKKEEEKKHIGFLVF